MGGLEVLAHLRDRGVVERLQRRRLEEAAEGGGAELREGLGARAQRVDGGVDRLEVVGEGVGAAALEGEGKQLTEPEGSS